MLLTFDGGKQVSASLVIACDDTFSKVREYLDKTKTASLPIEPFLLDRHKTVWRGTASTVDAKNIATFLSHHLKLLERESQLPAS